MNELDHHRPCGDTACRQKNRLISTWSNTLSSLLCRRCSRMRVAGLPGNIPSPVLTDSNWPPSHVHSAQHVKKPHAARWPPFPARAQQDVS
ncbi:hypothetical protein BaRGS_00003966 [Batillaria attramentaria]|uniref:Uncharacterized protein n=1 Tax=Batillaria attramentaria TaxID=370345 RepID=A0ABD0KIU0_9CAEN